MTTRAVAVIQFGIMGYILEDNVRFTAADIDGLIKKINKKIDELARMIEAAQEKDGDLRQFTPEFANGYQSIGNVEIEFGEDFSGCILSLTLGKNELVYNTKGYRRLMQATSLN